MRHGHSLDRHIEKHDERAVIALLSSFRYFFCSCIMPIASTPSISISERFINASLGQY
jgi:hypothetical protein